MTSPGNRPNQFPRLPVDTAIDPSFLLKVLSKKLT
jgi:hypothetical protein